MKNRPPTWNGIEIPYALSVDELRQAANGSESTSRLVFVALAHHPDDSASSTSRESCGQGSVCPPYCDRGDWSSPPRLPFCGMSYPVFSRTHLDQ